MEQLMRALADCLLFQGFSNAEIKLVLQVIPNQMEVYRKGEPLAIEGNPCPGIGIVIKGSAEIQRVYASGKTVTIDMVRPGDSFGEVILFSNVSYFPVTIMTRDETQVMFLSKKAVIDLCGTNSIFLNNLLRQLSNRILLLNQRIKSLSYQSIRQKIADLILDESRRQGSDDLRLPFNRNEMAEMLGIPRPSLSREMAWMKRNGWIDFHKSMIKILDQEALQDSLIE